LPSIDVKGEVDAHLFVSPNSAVNYQVFFPILSRRHDEDADDKWINIRWGQGQVETLEEASGGLNSISYKMISGRHISKLISYKNL